jgi:hypothetical protein
MLLRLILRAGWNVAVLFIAGSLLWLIAPKVYGQLLMVAQDGAKWSPFTRFVTGWVGAEGLALLVLILLGAHSLGTWAWRRNPPRVRWTYACIGIVLFLGVIVSIISDHLHVGHIFYDDYIVFLFVYALFAFPILVFGRAYPALLARLFLSWRNRRSGAPHERNAPPA